MTTRTIAMLYDHYDDAAQIVRDLEAAGIDRDRVSIVASNVDNRYMPADVAAKDATTASGAGTGASIGAALGGGAGLLAGIGVLAIPGVGPVVAAGWLIATLVGAAAGAGIGAASGGLVDALTSTGTPADHAHVYAEGVRRGGTLVTVRVDEAQAAQATSIMRKGNPVDPDMRGQAYREGGWKAFDPAAEPLSTVELERDRALYRRPRAA